MAGVSLAHLPVPHRSGSNLGHTRAAAYDICFHDFSGLSHMALVRPQVVPLSHEGIQRIFAMAYSMPLWLKSRLIFWRDLESFQPVAGSRTNCKCLICFLWRVLAKTATLVTKIAGQWLPREDATLGFDPSPTTPQESKKNIIINIRPSFRQPKRRSPTSCPVMFSKFSRSTVLMTLGCATNLQPDWDLWSDPWSDPI